MQESLLARRDVRLIADVRVKDRKLAQSEPNLRYDKGAPLKAIGCHHSIGRLN